MSNSPIYTETYDVFNLINKNEENEENDTLLNLEIEFADIPSLEKPFLNFQNKQKKIYYLYTPFINKKNYITYNNLTNSKFTKIGLSIYQEFPSNIKNKYEDKFHKNNPFDYLENTKLWLHPFRNPNDFDLINDNINYFFNFSNFFIDNIENIPQKNIDILIICDNFFNVKSKRWLKYYHNINLINKVLPFLVKSNLNITIIDPMNIVNQFENINYIYDENLINKTLEFSKICIIFNKHASFIPYIGNALLRNNCLLMYHSILGEWNLINKYTGSFFSDQKTLIQNITNILTNINNFKPKKWYTKKHKPQHKINELYKKIYQLT